ncbi:MAG: hypothetical protein H7125_16635 [Proteobacteria bacterium]|nr:hypothetical protein [Burkholderiales bacterium]
MNPSTKHGLPTTRDCGAMQRRSSGLPAATVFAIGALVCASAFAQGNDPAKERERRLLEQVRRAQSAQQQLAKEKAELEKAREDLDAQLKSAEATGRAAQGRAGTLKREVDAASARLAEERANGERLKAELAASTEAARSAQKAMEARIQQLTTDNAETLRRVGLRETQLRTLQETSDERATRLDECTTRFDGVYRVGLELVEQLRARTAGQADPVFQFGRVEGFESAQTFRDRLDEQRFGKGLPRNP